MSQQGQLRQIDFFDNTGGTNLVDSVFKIQPHQAAGGVNFDYILTGGIRKSLGTSRINSTPDTQLDSLGFGLYAPQSGTSKSVFRAGGIKLQLVDTSTPAFTNLSEDTAVAGSSPFAANTTQNVVFTQFSNSSNDILWAAGGGLSAIIGAYSTTKYTTNGAAAPSGTFSAATNSHNGGSWSTGNFGVFYYSFVWRKRSTLAFSNAAQDCTATTANLDDTVTLTIAPPSDTTLYDQVWVYRSSVGGVTGFTAGSLIAQLASTTTTFVDKGNIGNPDILSSQVVPRPKNVVLDNSQLPSNTYNTLALWGHRLATSAGNTLYISDVNKSESWPLTNYLTIPSAGPITALATISFTSPQANSLQELLVVFKERELWVVSPGLASDYTTWTLLKVDSNVGCPNQALLVSAQGFLSWLDYRGVWLWDGTSKPIYCSRLLEPLFGTNGDLDKTKFNQACSAFFRRENEIVWFLSSKTYGTQKFAIKMDIRLTLLQIEQNLTGRVIDAVLIQAVHVNPIYAAMSYVPLNGQDEQMIMGDQSGYCYFGSTGYSDGGSDYLFRYLTPALGCGNPNVKKQFHSVIAWVQDVGNWNLYLDYWADYQTSSVAQTTQGLPLSTENQSAALWDIATYDLSLWDSYSPSVVPLVFNLQAGSANSAQGSAIQLQFRNDTQSNPVTIHGFSVVYSELGGVTA